VDELLRSRHLQAQATARHLSDLFDMTAANQQWKQAKPARVWLYGDTGWRVHEVSTGVFRVYTPAGDWYRATDLEGAKRFVEQKVAGTL
jgi:hypothetical protein